MYTVCPFMFAHVPLNSYTYFQFTFQIQRNEGWLNIFVLYYTFWWPIIETLGIKYSLLITVHQGICKKNERKKDDHDPIKWISYSKSKFPTVPWWHSFVVWRSLSSNQARDLNCSLPHNNTKVRWAKDSTDCKVDWVPMKIKSLMEILGIMNLWRHQTHCAVIITRRRRNNGRTSF